MLIKQPKRIKRTTQNQQTSKQATKQGNGRTTMSETASDNRGFHHARTFHDVLDRSLGRLMRMPSRNFGCVMDDEGASSPDKCDPAYSGQNYAASRASSSGSFNSGFSYFGSLWKKITGA